MTMPPTPYKYEAPTGPFKVTGLTGSFETQITEWEKKFQRTEVRQEALSTRITAVEQIQRDAQEAVDRLALKQAALYYQPGTLYFPSTREAAAGEEQFELAKQQLVVLNAEFLVNIFYADLYNLAPVLITTGAANSVDEVFALLAIPPELSDTQLASAKYELAMLFASRDRDVPQPLDIPELEEGEPAVAAVKYPPLVPPAYGITLLPVSIHQLSTQELLKTLMVPKVPETQFTDAEYQEYLRTKGWSEEDIDNELQITRDKLIAEAQERKNMIESYRNEVAALPPLELTDLLQMAIMNPPLLVLEGLGFYYEHVSMPAAGWLYQQIPDIQKAYDEFIKANPGATDREAFVYAWEKWDAPGPPVIDFILKYIIMEGIVDPLTYVGWGIVSRGLKPLGPAGRFIAAGNQAAAEVMELPFDFLKYAARKIPKTVLGKAGVSSRESLSILDAFFENYTMRGRVPLTFLKPKDMYNAADNALTHWAKNPRAEDNIAQAAAEMLVHPPVSRTEATNWLQRLRRAGVSTIEPTDLTDDAIFGIDEIFERVFTKEITVDEASPLLMQKLGVLYISEATEDATVLTGKFLAERANSIFSRAADFTLEPTANKVMQAYARKSLRIYEAIENSVSLMFARRNGRAQMLVYNLERGLPAAWAAKVNNMVVRPAAESYLTFGLYGPMNVIEDIWRSTLGGIKPGRMTVERNDILTVGLLDDPNIRISGLSEKYGPLRDAGEPMRSNWINTMAMLPLSLPTYAATRGKITPKRFATGAYDVLVERFGAIGMDMRRNYRGGKYLQLLADSGGDIFKALDDAVPKNLPDALSDSPKWVKRNLKNDLHMAATTGKLTTDNLDLVKALKARYTRDRILRAEVDDILMKYSDISPTARSLIMDGFDEKALLESPDTIDSYMRTVLDAEVDDFLRGPERATLQYQELTDLLTSLEVSKPEDMAELIVSLHRMTATYGALPDQIMARATIKSRGLPIADRQLQFDAEFDRLYTFMDNAGANIDRVIDFVGAQPHMKGAYGDATQRYLDLATSSRKLISEAKAQDMAFRTSYFADATQKQLREHSFWNSFYASENAHWKATSKKLAAINSNLHNAINDINAAAGIRIPTRPAVVVRGRPLAPADVGKLMGARGDDLSKMLLDTLIPEGDKDYFVEYIMGMVREGQDVGFDRVSVGAVYDQIADSILVDPASSSWFRVRQKQLESMTRDFHDLYNAKLFPVEQKRAVDGFVDGVARAADDVVYEKAPAIKEGITPEELAARGGYQELDTAITARNNLRDKYAILQSKGESGATTLRQLETADAKVNKLYMEARGIKRFENGVPIFEEPILKPEFAPAKPVSPEDIADSLGLRFDGMQEQGGGLPDLYMFSTRKYGQITFTVDNLSQVESTLAEKFTQFGVTEAPPKLPARKPGYDDVRQSALDEANKWYYKEYTDYTNANALDAVMKQIYPFWTYESQRWFWLPRSFVRRPGTLTAWGRWQNNTDYGYVHIPGTSIDVNPQRGTVYGPWSTRMMRRDYPEYYDNLEGMGGMVGFFDWISRYGFYPNVIYGALMAQFGGASPQTGGILPSIASTPLNAAIAAFPDNKLVEFISERIFPEMFRQYLTSRRVDDLGGDGSLIFAKRKANQELTEEEEAMWTEARGFVALHSAGFEQFGMLRMRSDESYELAQAAAAFIEEQWGFTPEQQRTARMRGEKLWDLIGGLDPWETAVLQEMDFFKYSGSINPVLPSHKQEILNKIELDWADVMAYSETVVAEILELQEDFLTGSERGRLSPDSFLQRVREQYAKRRDYIDVKTKANPLMLLENRTEYYAKYGEVMPVQSPYNELMDMYFSIELEEIVDPATGERVYDWDKFWANREMITAAIPESDKGRWTEFLSRHTAPAMQVWHDVYNTYFRKYYGLWDKTLTTYSDEEQALITEYLFLEKTQQQLERQEEIKNTESSKDDRLLISSFRSAVSDERAALRYANPHLDAWLYYWGRTTSFKSLTGEEVYIQLAKNTGRRIE